jgi:hypothetical protein
MYIKFCVIWYPLSPYCENKFTLGDPEIATNDESVTGSNQCFCCFILVFLEGLKQFRFCWKCIKLNIDPTHYTVEHLLMKLTFFRLLNIFCVLHLSVIWWKSCDDFNYFIFLYFCRMSVSSWPTVNKMEGASSRHKKLSIGRYSRSAIFNQSWAPPLQVAVFRYSPLSE